MDAPRWRELSAWLDQLLELPPGERQARLLQIGQRDPALQAQLQQLLAQEADSEHYLSQPLWSAPAAAREGSQVGPYRLLRLLGEGGMGEVWLAERCDGLFHRTVALKLLRSGLADPGLQARFARERQILARLQHPHLAQLLDAGVDAQGHPYVVLDHVRGEPITDYCTRLALPLDACVQLLLQVCAVVSHAHTNLVVHRDLKPSNILVADDGGVKLLDFGIAQLLDPEDAGAPSLSDVRAFTLHYAAPEQVRGEPVTTLTDVYSLGVVLYELTTGRKPYRLRRQSDSEWERAVMEARAPLASQLLLQQAQAQPTAVAARALQRRARQTRGSLDAIVCKALRKDPAQRYGSVEALADDLRRFLQHRPVQAHVARPWHRVGLYLRRHRLGVAAAAVAVLAVLGGTATALWQMQQARQEMARRQAMQEFTIGVFDRAASIRAGRLDLATLLSTAQQRGEIELATQPLALAELQGVIGRLRIGLGDYRAALAALDRQQALLQAISQEPEELQLQAATQRARALRMLGRDGECVQQLLPLRGLTAQLRTRLPARAAEFDSQLGRCQAQLGEYVQARDAFQRAVALRRRAGAGPLAAAESLADLASLDAVQGRAAAALRGYQQALRVLEQARSGQTPQAIQLRRQVGLLLAARGQPDAAARTLEQAWRDAVQAFGPGHPESLVVRRDRALLALTGPRRAWAGEELRHVRQALATTLGPAHREVGQAEQALGDWARASGEDDAAVLHYRNAVRIWSAPDHIALLPQALVALGQAERARGDPQAAAQAWRQARVLLAAQRGAQASEVQALDARLAGVPTVAERPGALAAGN